MSNLKHKVEMRPHERRRHQRVTVAVLGRMMLENKTEHACQTVNMSPGGVSLIADVKARLGEKVVVYLDHLGRIEGITVRHTERGFIIMMTLPVIKREKLADQLTWLANREMLGMLEDRRHERFVPRRVEIALKMPDDSESVVKILDLSMSGVGVAMEPQPALGTRVLVGRTPGKVVRHFPNGVAIEFNRLLPAEIFDEDIDL